MAFNLTRFKNRIKKLYFIHYIHFKYSVSKHELSQINVCSWLFDRWNKHHKTHFLKKSSIYVKGKVGVILGFCLHQILVYSSRIVIFIAQFKWKIIKIYWVVFLGDSQLHISCQSMKWWVKQDFTLARSTLS